MGGHTIETSPQVWTTNLGHYEIDLKSAAVAGATVTMTIVAQSQPTTPTNGGLPAYIISTNGHRDRVLTYDDFDETLPNVVPANHNYTDGDHGHTFDYDGSATERYDAASFAAFSMLKMDYLAATQGMGVTFTSPLIVEPLLDKGSGDSKYRHLSKSILIGLDAVANCPDIVAHEFGHYVADTGGFQGDKSGGEDPLLDTNLRAFNASPPTSVLTTNSVQKAFGEGWADYFAAVAPSLVPGGTGWLKIQDLTDSAFSLSGLDSYNAATPGGWGEDNEISVMRILYQLTEGNQRLGTPAQLYSWLSAPAHEFTTLSAFWNSMLTFSPMTLSQLQQTAARAKVFVANGVGPTVTAPTVKYPGPPPAVKINFSVPNLNTVSGTGVKFLNLPTFSQAEVVIYNNEYERELAAGAASLRLRAVQPVEPHRHSTGWRVVDCGYATGSQQDRV